MEFGMAMGILVVYSLFIDHEEPSQFRITIFHINVFIVHLANCSRSGAHHARTI